ncbi:MAG: hypothetical protein IJ325_11745 [Clostridia bacterium]|nr:hypothetical protein [Clostridia bacterium]
MRGKDLLDKLNNIDSKYVESAENAQKKKNTAPVKWTAAAACVSLAAIIGVLAWHMQDIPDPLPPDIIETDTGETEPIPETTPGTETAELPLEAETGNTNLGGISRDYKDIFVGSGEMAIEWSWEYKTMAEKFTELTISDVQYSSSGRYLDASLLGGFLGTYDLVGYDYSTDERHTMAAEVYRIDGISEDSMVAAGLDGKYVIFKDRTYDPPATFGELLDEYSLAENLPFDRFTVYEGHTDTGYFSLEDDWYIWQILEECRDAAYVEEDRWGWIEGEYLSFTATSDALGVYKKVVYVTSDGELHTNVFEYGYIYDIGEEAAGKILAYAKENSTAAQPEPYVNSLAGTLVAISDGYILADDTFLCTDKEDGMVFRIPTTDLRISRSMTGIEVGDIIVVDFTGDIDVEAGNIVTGAYSISEGFIQNGEVAVIE